MLNEHISTILLVTGIITALPILQFLAPKPVIKLMYKTEVEGPVGLVFARHWGLMAAVFGALLIYASSHPQVRGPIVAGAMVEKAGLAVSVFAAWGKPYAAGMRLAGIFDAACTIIFAIWLFSA